MDYLVLYDTDCYTIIDAVSVKDCIIQMADFFGDNSVLFGKALNGCTETEDMVKLLEWRKDYMSFYRWSMDNGYKIEMMEFNRNRYTLDRIDVNGDYTPKNCRWVDYREQADHKRHTLPLEINGETKPIIEWLHQFNATVPYFYCLMREGMTEKEALEFIMKD